jgi:hypothetical protein
MTLKAVRGAKCQQINENSWDFIADKLILILLGKYLICFKIYVHFPNCEPDIYSIGNIDPNLQK